MNRDPVEPNRRFSRDPAAGRRTTVTHSSSGRVWMGLLVAIGLVAAALGAYWVWHSDDDTRSVTPPEPDVSHAVADVASAVQRAREHVLLRPDDASAWGRLGMVCFAHEFVAEANVCFARASSLDPDDYRWAYLWGLNVGIADPGVAADCYRRALQLKPDLAVAATRLGDLLLSQHQLDEADRQYASALERKPDEVRALVGRAKIALARTEYQQGLDWARQARSLRSDVGEIHALVAQLHQRLGESAEAREALSLAQEYAGNELYWDDPLGAEVLQLRRDPGWSLSQARQLAAEGQRSEALALLQKAIAAEQRDPRLYVAAARLMLEQQQLMDCEQLLRQALEIHPASAELWFQQGTLKYFTNRLEGAREDFGRALERKPDYFLAAYNLGQACQRLQQWSGAEEAFRRAVSIQPGNAGAQLNLARALLELDRIDDAIPHLESAVRLNPDDVESRELLEQSRRNQESSTDSP